MTRRCETATLTRCPLCHLFHRRDRLCSNPQCRIVTIPHDVRHYMRYRVVTGRRQFKYQAWTYTPTVFMDDNLDTLVADMIRYSYNKGSYYIYRYYPSGDIDRLMAVVCDQRLVWHRDGSHLTASSPGAAGVRVVLCS